MALFFGLKTVTDWFHKIAAKFQIVSNDDSETENGFQTLTPIVDPYKEGYQPYFKALDYALNRDDVKNIAITGPYGAGKSSVILSYLKNIERRKRLLHRLKYWLNFTKLKPADEHVIISLANFKTDKTLKSSESLSKEQSIEYSILQQILYKVDKGSVPDSRVERIHSRNRWQVLNTSCLLFFIITLTSIVTTLLLPQKIISTFSLSPAISNFITINPLWRWGCIATLAFIICWFLLSRFYKIGFFDKKIALDKVNLLKAEFAAEKQNTTSLLNLYIDEIVYFFIKTKYRIIIFEDLDRLNNGHIFIKLREINQIVNNSRLLEKKPIKFIFAVREDLLKDAESQTKFFDFIVPIIPAIDSENSFDILNNKIQNFKEENKEHFFKKVSLYLTDMRVMNNVINEFNLFKGLITGELSDTKLFSLIVYKNLCTKDFTLLDTQAGFLYKVVHAYSTGALQEEYFKTYEETLSALKVRVEQARKELQNSKETLRDELLQRYLPSIYISNARFYSYVNQYKHNTTSWTCSELIVNEKLFCQFLQSEYETGVVITNSHNNSYREYFEISSDKRTELLSEYEKRTPIVLDNNKKTLELLSNKIMEIQNTVNLKHSISLHELCEKITLKKLRDWYFNDTPTKDEEKQNITNTPAINFNIDLLFFMLSNGYIEQDYMQYRSIFHAGALSQSDNLYIQKVAAKVNFDELKDIQLNNIPNIIEKMESLSFKYHEGIYHPDIINYLIIHRVELTQDILTHLTYHKNQNLINSAIWTYFSRFNNNNYQILINLILNDDRALSKLMMAMTTYEKIDSDDDFYEQLYISFIRFGLIEKIAKQSALQNYLHGLKKDTALFKYIQADEIESFTHKLKELNIIFDTVNEASTDNDVKLLNFIAENHLYIFNIDNLTSLYNAYSDSRISIDNILKNPCSLIFNKKIPCLIDAVYKNSEMFISKYFIHSNEDVNTIISLINNSDITACSKITIIESMKFEVQQLTVIQNIDLDPDDEESYSVYDQLFKNRRIAANWKNIFDYMYTEADEEILWLFFDTYSGVLFEHELNIPDESVSNIMNYIISAVDKPDRLYAQLISVLPISIEKLISDLPLTKFKILCTNNRVLLSETLYEDILSTYVDERRKDLNECLFLIIKHNIIIFEDNIEFYLKDDDDLDNGLIELLLNNDEIVLNTKVQIINTIWSYYSVNFFDHISLNKAANMAILLNITEDEIRLACLNYHLEFEEPSHEDITRALRSFVSKEYNLIADDTKRAKVLKTDSNESLLEHLRVCQFISSYKDKGKYFEVYHRRRPSPEKQIGSLIKLDNKSE
ncbi:YobI family P-loop NTPase [Providencia sp. PROV138]|uniref:YobI family P-loop NTPase n=1 Tax=Providencia sp. PROV138 TaxID=2949848 RepID=UPI00234931AB|nr:hypothetical protein [Providencia sp. PROV138]